MIADWLRWIHRPQTVRLRDEWMRMLGIVFATFGSHVSTLGPLAGSTCH